jgi:hypothetical protein
MDFNVEEINSDFEYASDFDFEEENDAMPSANSSPSVPSLSSFQTIQKSNISFYQQQQQQQQQQQPKLTYDDILTNMNVRLVNGKLQFNRNDEAIKQEQAKSMNKSVRFQQTPQARQPHQAWQAQQAIQVPLTPQEYKRRQIILQLQHQARINHLNQIKSKKLLIPNPNIHSTSTMGLWGSKSSGDRLFRMMGR